MMEYPNLWLAEEDFPGWNEVYMLRAFLQYNSAFEIISCDSLLVNAYPDYFRANMPLCVENPGGSIWLRRL